MCVHLNRFYFVADSSLLIAQDCLYRKAWGWPTWDLGSLTSTLVWSTIMLADSCKMSKWLHCNVILDRWNLCHSSSLLHVMINVRKGNAAQLIVLVPHSCFCVTSHINCVLLPNSCMFTYRVGQKNVSLLIFAITVYLLPAIFVIFGTHTRGNWHPGYIPGVPKKWYSCFNCAITSANVNRF